MSDSGSDIEEQDFVIIGQSDSVSDPKVAQKVAQITAWLQPTDYLGESSDFKKHLNSHVPGTGEWLYKTAQYQQWHDLVTYGSLWV